MPLLLLIVVLAVIIAQVGFWNTPQAVLGAVAMLVLLVVLVAAGVALGIYVLVRRVRSRF